MSDPFARRGLLVALDSSELAWITADLLSEVIELQDSSGTGRMSEVGTC